MSHSLSSVTIEDVPGILEAGPLEVSKKLKLFLWLLVAMGIAVFVLGINGENSRLAWISFHLNLVFWIFLSAAGAGFSAVFSICNAQWARPVERLFQSCVVFLPIGILLLLVLYFGHEQLFVWATEPVHGKELWLESKFLFIRDIIGASILLFLLCRVIYYSLRADFLAIRGGIVKLDDSRAKRWLDKRFDNYAKFSAGALDVRDEIARAMHKRGRYSPVVVICYAVIMSMLAFDLMMSVDPHWYSTLYGAFLFMTGVYLAFAWISVVIALAREWHPLYRKKIDRRCLHDVGKLLFGFGIFWAYLFWSHYLPIWYGNMPEETAWVIVRLREQPWHGLAWMVFGSAFIVPFLLGLSRDVKQMPSLLMATGLIVIVGLWLQQYVLFVPTLFPTDIPIGLRDIAISLAFGAAFLLSQLAFLRRVPLVAFGDFYIRKAD
ncbi:MAG: hypothetical protein IT291_02545 [Deltaproteobacteria bacterium]|nr:hypothetical protein [Deltaproteobacteria bacterium]